MDDLVGERIRLDYTSDQYTHLKAGDEGTVDFVDDMGTIFVIWDNSSNLGLIPGEDKYTII